MRAICVLRSTLDEGLAFAAHLLCTAFPNTSCIMSTATGCSSQARVIAATRSLATAPRPAPFAGLRRANVLDKDVAACPAQQVSVGACSVDGVGVSVVPKRCYLSAEICSPPLYKTLTNANGSPTVLRRCSYVPVPPHAEPLPPPPAA
jgi:hypothetical protein